MLKAKVIKSFPGFNLDVELSLGGELTVILGPSGSGKTMTLQCIAGLTTPTEGCIELGGNVLFDSSQRINLPTKKRRVGFVFQNYALFPHMTVTENIAYSIRRLPSEEARTKVSQLLDMMNIGALDKRYPRQLSAGQQQRVAIARALAPDPEILLLDEPFSALDSQLRERLELELLELAREYKGSMLLVTHDLAEGYRLGTKVAVYHGGRIAQCDTRQKVFSSPVSRTVARLTGVRNFLDGEISRLEPLYLWVNVPAWGITLKVLRPAGRELSPGERVVLGIRSDGIRMAQAGNCENTENVIGGRVLQSVESISHITYRIMAACDPGERHPLNVSVGKSQESPLSEGEQCMLCLSPENLMLIPESAE